MVSQILIVMIAAIAVTIFAERRNIQPPLLLALVGVIASFIPGMPRLELEPDIILGVVLPPLLYAAASDFSFTSFIRRFGSIFNLGVLLVLVTTVVVGGVAALVIPGMTLSAAIVLAAVVSPPDAVTAVAIGRKLGLPSRLMTVLAGESLINDAAALTFFTFAVAAVTGTHLFISNGFLFFLYSAIVGILLGAVIGTLVHRIRLHLPNPTLATVMSVLVPFAAYFIAEELSASGVLAVVAAGFWLGHASSEANYAVRIQEGQFWRTVDAILEAFVFAYIGLQMRFIIEDVSRAGFDVWSVLGVSLLVLLAVLVVRIAWVFATAVLFRWRYRQEMKRRAQITAGIRRPRRREVTPPPDRTDRRGKRNRRGDFELPEPFTWKENLVIGWTGMRGVVTLAAAAGIPLLTASGTPFPGREIIQLVAFIVTIGTLLLQGLTLPKLIALLKLEDPKEKQYRVAQTKLARQIGEDAARTAVVAFAEQAESPQVKEAALKMAQRFTQSREEDAELLRRSGPMLEIGRLVLTARRTALIEARDNRQLEDEILREVLKDLDLQEAMFAAWEPGRLSGEG